MPAFCVDHDGERPLALETSALRELLATGGFFWLDVVHPSDAELRLIGESFGFHPLALEDAMQFGTRPRLESYDDEIFLVAYAAASRQAADLHDRLVEVHVFFSSRWLVTIRRAECEVFAELRRRVAQREYAVEHPLALLYHLLDGLIESFFPLLNVIDDRIDSLADSILERPTDDQLNEVFELKRRLVGLRRVVTPQRDYLGAREVALAIPGMSDEGERYFRDLYDRLVRLSESIDSYRDLLTSTMDVYLSTVSNRLNVVITKLTVIATIFLPITFITGFFGQNFDWLIGHVGGLGSFLALGIGLNVAATIALVGFMWRRGWF